MDPVAKTSFTSVTQYIASKPKDARAALNAVRRAIRKAVPKAEERISYQIPASTLNGAQVIFFAGWKGHYAIYPVNDALVAKFARELAPYERSKGTIKFPFTEPVPEKLIERIAKFRADQLVTRDGGKRGRRTPRETQLDRLRRMCATLPSVSEKLSHGAPCFFVEKGKGVFAMFADHHHEDGRLALWCPVKAGLQPLMIEEAQEIYFKPPYVGTSGWVGIVLDKIGDDALHAHLREAWDLIARTKKKPRR